jgi:multiple antibiotic resistance protein
MDWPTLADFTSVIPLSYAALFPVLNPLGSAFIFLGMTHLLTPKLRRRLALKIAINSFVLLAVVLWVGEWVLRFFGVGIPVVQVAGGLVLCSIGWKMMSQNSTASDENEKSIRTEAEANASAFFPLTMPLTAGPGSMAVALTVGAHENVVSWPLTVIGKFGAMVGLLLGVITVYFCYGYADKITRKLGESGSNVIVKLSSFIIFCIGLTILWHGLQELAPNALG